MAATTIVPEEAELFGRLASNWWDPDGRSAMLHKLNPVRLKYVRDQIDRHWQCDECSRTPLEGKRALDVGCGAGLLAEPRVAGLRNRHSMATAAQLRRHAEHCRYLADLTASPQDRQVLRQS